MNTKLLIDRYRRNSVYSLSILSIIAIDAWYNSNYNGITTNWIARLDLWLTICQDVTREKAIEIADLNHSNQTNLNFKKMIKNNSWNSQLIFTFDIY